MLDPDSECYNLSDWYAYFGFWFVLDELVSLQPQSPTVSLPQDSDGYLVTDSGPTFEGGAVRSNDWMVILSAVNSHVPLIGESIYRLDRQSRLDIWHPAVGLVVGGGHNLRGAETALANAVLLTGWNGVDCDFGVFPGTSNYQDRLAACVPRSLDLDITLERQRLRESFGQGDITFEVRPQDKNRLTVAFNYDVFSTKKLLVQLPLIVLHGSLVRVDGKRFEGNAPVDATHEVTISNPGSGTAVRVAPPAGMTAKLRPAVDPVRWYVDDHLANRYEPFYRICLLSVQIEEPGDRGGGEFGIEIIEK